MKKPAGATDAGGDDPPYALFAVTTDRDEWLDRAEALRSLAEDGHSREAQHLIGQRRARARRLPRFGRGGDEDDGEDDGESESESGAEGDTPRRRRPGAATPEAAGGRRRKLAGPLSFIPPAPTLHLEEESSLFRRAADAYRISGGRWLDAAACQGRAASVQGRGVRCPETAAALCGEAGMIAEKGDPREAVRYYARAISLYCEVEKYGVAGRLQKRSAALLETRERDLVAAVDSYRRASNYFLAANLPMQSHFALERAAHLLGGSTMGRYREAAALYASLGEDLLEFGNLTKRSAARTFFRSGLLRLAADVGRAGAEDGLDELEGMLRQFRGADCLFRSSREHAFLEKAMEAVRSDDLTSFADHVYHYDSVCPLDPWCLQLLDRVRLGLSEE